MSDKEMLCRRCSGDGWKLYPSWLRHVNGMCYRCEGTGIEPRSEKMCGTLKFENMAARRGEPVPCFNPASNKAGKAIWDGFAHSEKQDWWIKEGNAVAIDVRVDAFVEGNVTLRIPEGQPIKALGLRQDVRVQGRAAGRAKQVKILTRGPLNPFEAKLHPRWPLVLKDNQPFQWSEKDILSGPAQGTLF